jgi:hypothetical protein
LHYLIIIALSNIIALSIIIALSNIIPCCHSQGEQGVAVLAHSSLDLSIISKTSEKKETFSLVFSTTANKSDKN